MSGSTPPVVDTSSFGGSSQGRSGGENGDDHAGDAENRTLLGKDNPTCGRKTPDLFDKAFAVFHKIRIGVILGWAVGAITCAYFALQFMTVTTISFTPPASSLAGQANALEKEYFPDSYDQGMLVAMLMNERNASIYGDWAENTTIALRDIAYSYEDEEMVGGVLGYYLAPRNSSEPIFTELALRILFVSESTRSTLVFVSTTETATMKAFDFNNYFREKVKKLDTQGGNYSIWVCGYDALLADVQTESVHDLEMMDVIALPAALLILLSVIRAITLMIIPVINVSLAVVYSFALMYPIAMVWDVATFSTSLMMSIIIAMNIDYSLFLLTRYREELGYGHTNYESVSNSLRHAGRIVATSGSILLITIFSIAVFPVALLASEGVAGGLALLFTILLNLTLTPALLLTFGKFFSIPGVLPCKKSCRTVEVLPPEERVLREQKTFWYMSASFSTTTKWSVIIILVTFILLTPLCVMLIYFEWSLDNMQVIPSGCPAMEALDAINTDWPEGEIYPYQILTIASEPYSIESPEFYNISQIVLAEISNTTYGFPEENELAISKVGTIDINYGFARLLLDKGEIVYSALFSVLTNVNKTANHMILIPDFNPAILVAETCNGIRAVLDKYNNENTFTFYLRNQIVDEYDAVEATIDLFPYMILGTFAVIVLLLVIVFRSAFLPVRIVITLILTLGSVYGLASMFFCTSWFDWIGTMMASNEGMYWIGPIMCFSVIVGLGLDYDIFLFSRIVEYRKQGYDYRSAIIKGVQKTGHVITFAGLIMAVSFAGLMLSSEMLLVQCGFLLAVAVLLDTFVIRTLLNPAILCLSRDWSYWPMKYTILYTDPTLIPPSPKSVNTF